MGLLLTPSLGIQISLIIVLLYKHIFFSTTAGVFFAGRTSYKVFPPSGNVVWVVIKASAVSQTTIPFSSSRFGYFLMFSIDMINM